MRAPENGQPQPLDGDLVAEGDHFEAANALTEPELTADPDRAVTFTDPNVSIGVAEDSGEVRQVADKLFYPNAARDSDVLIAPTAAGVQVSYQLRSADSPESFVEELSLPAGASLHVNADGGATIRDGAGDALVEIAPPAAWDSEFTAVPVEYELDGDDLIIRVTHRERDLLYPILVDPEYWIESYYQLTPDQNIEYWEAWSDYWAFTWSRDPEGLKQAAPAGPSYPNWGSHQFRIHSSGESFIERVNFYNFDRYAGNPATCTAVGIWNPGTNNWEPGTVQNEIGTNLGANGQAVQAICDGANQQINHNTRYAWVGWDPDPHDWVYDQIGSNGNFGVFALYTPNGAARQTVAWNLLRSATIFRYDYNNPGAAFVSPPSTAWRDDGGGTQTLSALGTDAGLGIKALELGGTSAGTVRVEHSCTGRREAVCPSSWQRSINYAVTEGRSTLTLTGEDIIGHRTSGPPSLVQRIDRTAPSVSLLGTLHDAAQGGSEASPAFLYGPSYGLQIQATDGSTAAPGAERSGVKDLTISVDGSAVYTPPAISCPDGSCSASWNWTLATDSYADAVHTITVTVRDQLNHPFQRTYFVEIDRRGDIYHVRKVTGDPDAGGTVLREEWASFASHLARSEHDEGASSAIENPITILSADELGTRQTVSCQVVGSTACGEVRTLDTTRFSDGNIDTAYTRLRGVSADDPKLPLVAEVLEIREDHGSGGTSGSLAQVLRPWQTPPPASGSSYLYFRTTQNAGPEVLDVWLEQTTRLPVRTRIVDTSTGAVVQTTYWDYEPRRMLKGELPSGFFNIPKPSNPKYSEEVDANSAGASIGSTKDNDTGANFLPYDLGDEIILQLQLATSPVHLCLIGVDTVRFSEPPEPASDIGAEFENENPGWNGRQTFVASNYAIRPSTAACPPASELSATDVQVISTHPDSQYGEDAAAAHQLGVAAGATSNLASGLENEPLVSSPSTATQTVMTGEGSTSTWVEPAVGPATVLVQGPIELPFVPAVIAALRPR